MIELPVKTRPWAFLCGEQLGYWFSLPMYYWSVQAFSLLFLLGRWLVGIYRFLLGWTIYWYIIVHNSFSFFLNFCAIHCNNSCIIFWVFSLFLLILLKFCQFSLIFFKNRLFLSSYFSTLFLFSNFIYALIFIFLSFY